MVTYVGSFPFPSDRKFYLWCKTGSYDGFDNNLGRLLAPRAACGRIVGAMGPPQGVDRPMQIVPTLMSSRAANQSSSLSERLKLRTPAFGAAQVFCGVTALRCRSTTYKSTCCSFVERTEELRHARRGSFFEVDVDEAGGSSIVIP